MINILLVGCGYWGKNWYKTIKSSPYNLVGVVDPNPSIEVDVPLFKSVNDVGVEYTHAIIATNAEIHSSISKCMIGKKLLIEKPCGTDMNRPQLFGHFPGFVYLSSPQFKIVKNAIDSGRIGNILYSRFERASMGPRIRTDVSIIEDYAIHDLYIYKSLFENDRVKTIGGKLLETFDYQSMIQPDTMFLTIESDTSTYPHVSTFFSSWRYHKKVRKIEICGTSGTILWEDEHIYFSDSKYTKIEGYDKYRNYGYELSESPTYKIEVDTSKSNLHLELDDFINDVDRTKIFKDTHDLIISIKGAIE